LAVAPGIVLGNAARVDRAPIPIEHVHMPPSLLESEVSRLYEAVEKAEAAIDELEASLESSDGTGEHLGILGAHKVMLRDPMLLNESERHIREQSMNAEWAVSETLDHIGEIFAHIDDPFFRERGSDVEHVGDLLLRMLAGEEGYDHAIEDISRGAVVVADSLSPAEALSVARRSVSAFVLEHGTMTSHTAIVARSMNIPAVVGVAGVTEHIGEGDRIIVDGDEGEVIVSPTREEELVYARRERRQKAFRRALRQNRDADARTTDGVAITLRGNLDFASDVARIGDAGGEGIGLFRTEFLFIDRADLPDEEEQLDIYTRVLHAARPHPVTIRTLDLGGDKQLQTPRSGITMSPGLRAIRYCLLDRELFDTQLRALLRASVQGELRLLVPFITSMSEVRRVKRVIAEVREDLIAQGHKVADSIPLGFMVEVPGAALISESLAAEADFLSVGTNDLIQYTLAIARDDEGVAGLYQPLHPALLRLLTMVTQACKTAQIPVSICGEMAADPRYALVLLALGFNELSMTSSAIPLVKEVIRRSTHVEAMELLEQIQQMVHAGEIADHVDSLMIDRFSDIVRPSMRSAPRSAR
jgi:phosphoenolpyruvate-protein phosphotransferase (PTS system enzyme I)